MDENPFISAPPLRAAIYIASSKALFLEVSISLVKITALPVASTCLKFDLLRTGIKFGADYYIDDKAINSEDFF